MSDMVKLLRLTKIVEQNRGGSSLKSKGGQFAEWAPKI